MKRFGLAALTMIMTAHLGACDKDAQVDDKKEKSDKEEVEKEPEKLTAPKVKTGKIDLEANCDDSYPIDKNDAGKVVSCAIKDEMKVGDVTCRASGRPGAYDDLTLKHCGVKDVLEAGPLKCEKGVYFYEDGTIKSCILKEPIDIGEHKCAKRVEFDEDGEVRKCS